MPQPEFRTGFPRAEFERQKNFGRCSSCAHGRHSNCVHRVNDGAVVEFIDAVHERAPGMVGGISADEVLELFLEFRNTVALSRLRKIQASTPFSRPCYDKPHRCPGWAGGAWIGARVYRCENGSLIPASFRRRYWLGARCPACGLYVLPIVTRWLDPTWIWWAIRHPRRPLWTYWLSPRHIRLRLKKGQR